MRLLKCEKAGHFYDGELFNECPHCQKKAGPAHNQTLPAAPSPLHVGPTEPVHTPPAPEAPSSLRMEIQTAKDKEPVTIGFYEKTIGMEPVVGWLVCVEGPHFGRDYRLKSGRNFIGRASDMDVIISLDDTVSRDKHAIILYEPKKNLFIVQPGNSKELSYLNDDVVLSATEAKANDILTVGRTKLMLIPCCTEAFHWDNVKPKTNANE